MAKAIQWARFFKLEAVWSFVGGSSLVGALATIWAAAQSNAPKITSIGWLAVFFVCTLATIALVAAAGWARRYWQDKSSVPIPFTGGDHEYRSGLIAGFVKHSAPRQDDIEDKDWFRVCVGAEVRAEGSKAVRNVRAKVEVFDPRLWRLADEVFVRGDLRPGEEEECYPLELHINIKNDHLRYLRDGSLQDLSEEEELYFRLTVTSDDFPDQPISISRTARFAYDPSERFVLTPEATA